MSYDALNCHATNVRPSFFGGVVSTRLQAQTLNGVIIPQEPVAKKVTSGAKKPQATQTGVKRQKAAPVDHAVIKAAAAEKQRALAQRLRASLAVEEDDGDEVVKRDAPARPRSAGLAAKPSAALRAKMHEAQPAKASASSTSVHHNSSGQRVVTHSFAMPPSASPKLMPAPKAGAKRGKVQFKSTKPAKPLARAAKLVAAEDRTPRKQCRQCHVNKALNEYFEDKRAEGGLMHLCAECAQRKGLSGKLAKLPELLPPSERGRGALGQAAGVGQRGMHGRQGGEYRPSGGGLVGAPPGGPQLPRAGGTRQAVRRPVPGPDGGAFYRGAGGPAVVAPVVAAVRRGANGLQRRPALDEYEADFVEDDAPDGQDWRSELQSVTRGFYREARQDEPFNDRAMEASLQDMKREEARSKRIGRLEDLEAERQEAERLAAKAEKKRRAKKRKRSGANAFINDEASEDDDEDDD